MQTPAIFAHARANPFDETSPARPLPAAGELFLKLLNETAARRDEALPGYRETARRDPPSADRDAGVDDRSAAPRWREAPRETRPDPRDERREAASVERDDPRSHTREAGPERARAEHESPAADTRTSADARPDGERGTEPSRAATGNDGAPAAPGSSTQDPHVPAATPDAVDPAALAALPTIETAPATPPTTPGAATVQVAGPNSAGGETTGDGLRVTSPGSAAAPQSAPSVPGTASDGIAATPAQPGARDPNLPGTGAPEAGKLRALAGSSPGSADGPKTDLSPAAAAVTADAKRVANVLQGPLSADDISPGTHKTEASGADTRSAPSLRASTDPAATNNPALLASAVFGQGGQKPGTANGGAMKSELALAAAAKGAAATPGEGHMPAQAGMPTASSAQAAARVWGAPPAPADRPSGPAVPVGEVAVHLHRVAAKGEERIRIQLHPAELGQIDVRLKLGADGITRAVVQVDRAETLDLLQRDARGLERALQDAGLKTDPNSLSFNLRDNGQGGPREHHGEGRGLEGGNDHADAPEAAEEVEPHIRPSLTSRALDISV